MLILRKHDRVIDLTNYRPGLESRLYFYTNQLSDITNFLKKEAKFILPIRARDKDIIFMALFERIICKERINSLLSQYAYYYPYC